MQNERQIFEILEFLHARGEVNAEEWKAFVAKSFNIEDSGDRVALREDLEQLGLVDLRAKGTRRFLSASATGREWLEKNSAAFVIEEEHIDVEAPQDATSVDNSPLDFDEQYDFPTHPYDVRKLRVTPLNLSVFQVLRKIEKKEIVLRPSFQRAFVWDTVRQSRLIESLLIRIPLPAFYIDATVEEQWEVVDGLQRLTTMFRFWKNEFSLKNLQFLGELEGKSFEKLPSRYRILIEDNTQLLLYQLQTGTPPQAKFTIFSRLNTGGMTLTAQEIRNALFQGAATQLLASIAENPIFLEATTGSLSPKRMEDQEAILRGIAFLDGYSNYRSDLDAFLTETMDRLNKSSPAELKTIEIRLTDALNKAIIVFGQNSFRKIYRGAERRSNFNKALFESWVCALGEYPASALSESSEDIVEAFQILIEKDPAFVRSISYGTGSLSAVKMRFDKIDSLLIGVLL